VIRVIIYYEKFIFLKNVIMISPKICVFLLHILCLIFQLKSAKYIRYSLILIKKLIHKIFCINRQILSKITIPWIKTILIVYVRGNIKGLGVYRD